MSVLNMSTSIIFQGETEKSIVFYVRGTFVCFFLMFKRKVIAEAVKNCCKS